MFKALQSREAGGQPSPRAFQLAAAASPDLVARLELRQRLEGHAGCVNTVCFSECGSLLASGSDDRRVMLWDWNTGARVLSYRSGHSNNIFQARFIPHTSNSTIITCAADGQVRVGHLRDGGGAGTALLATHGGRAHKLALDPLQPQCFYSSGEDGRVFHFDLRCAQARQSLLVCSKAAPHGGRERLELHSIHCNPLRPWQFAVGGSDIFVRVYDQRQALQPTSARGASAAGLAQPVRRLAPARLRSRAALLHRGDLACSVTSAVFSRSGQLLASYNDENIYLFASEGPMPPGQASRQPAAAAAAEPTLASCRRRSGSARGQPQGPAEQPQSQQQQEQQQQQEPASSGGSPPRNPPGVRTGSGTVLPRRPSPASAPPPEEAAQQPPSNSSPAPTQPAADDSQQQARMETGSGAGSQQSAGESSPAGSSEAGSSQAGSSQAGSSQAGSSQAGSGEAGSSEADAAEGSSEAGSSESEGWDSDSDAEEAAYLLSREQLRRALAGQPIEESEEEGEADVGADADGAAEAEDEVLMTFTGHRNCRTVKGVSFLGERDEWVMSGSDDGHIYVWAAASGALAQWLPGDAHVVNCLEPHPAHPLAFATSGIEDDIKLWTPTAPEPRSISAAALRTMERNRMSQGPHRRPSSSVRRIVLQLQQMADGEGGGGGGAGGGGAGGGGAPVPGGCGVQ